MFLLITRLVILLLKLDLHCGQLIITLVLVRQLVGLLFGLRLDQQRQLVLLQPRGIRRNLLRIVQQRLIIRQPVGQLANQHLMTQPLHILLIGQHLDQLVV
jgi:hypothetical protein